ncbi:unnamed protein product [Rhizophagus irregularis]|uniref:HTH myb-type domain-containing protein n=2 Tax=Rhizophagus irregularis TaxID=588596 RepID=A0A2N1N6N7_9GLOM|nr:hypothetical protein RhiirC2_850641 [Rhizophagus irregularis]GBC11264.2 hypothetical protein GLOIN_2v618285 [Rhizophagus irregularis DAOM 181602=DAOM 197198]UZO05237.1 hypothetical protein OCT59_025596 [Rhizophagus irregularis]CAB4388697.1 unnamed protein product [Rhizophagus irregularis]CAB4439340.1 unnamed protein product [Rhizophagus irregularis]
MKVVLSEEEKKMFLNHMVELKRVGTRDPFAKLTKIFTYNARQLCHYWRNYLDPEVCQHNLYDYEKQYIDNWISLNRTEDGTICWKNLRQDLKNQFGLYRSENMLKNHWYSKQRCKKGTDNDVILSSPSNITNIPTSTRTFTTYNYPFTFSPQNRPSLPTISYIFNNPSDSTVDLPRPLFYQQNLYVLPTLQPPLTQEKLKLPKLPSNV